MAKHTTADLKWSKRVRERDKCCIICGKGSETGVLNAHHLVPRQFDEWRLEMDNGVTLCVHHHLFGKFSAHKNPIWFANWLRLNKKYEYLKASERINKCWEKQEK